MHMNEKLRERFAEITRLLFMLPDEQWVEIKDDGSLYFQCNTQEAVRHLRECFPGTVWDKRRDEYNNWWEYTGKYQGTRLHIYACREAPPTCKAIVKVIEVEEQVPVQFETRRVKKEVVTWDCGKED